MKDFCQPSLCCVRSFVGNTGTVSADRFDLQSELSIVQQMINVFHSCQSWPGILYRDMM